MAGAGLVLAYTEMLPNRLEVHGPVHGKLPLILGAYFAVVVPFDLRRGRSRLRAASFTGSPMRVLCEQAKGRPVPALLSGRLVTGAGDAGAPWTADGEILLRGRSEPTPVYGPPPAAPMVTT